MTASASADILKTGPVPELAPVLKECHERRFTRVLSSSASSSRGNGAVEVMLPEVGNELRFELRRGGTFSG